MGGGANHWRGFSMCAASEIVSLVDTYTGEHATADMRPFLDRVILGDCVKMMRNLPDGCADLILTDPPYVANYRDRDGRKILNDDNTKWIYPAFFEAYRVLKDDAFCISFYGWHKADVFLSAWRASGFRPVGHFTWVKTYASSVGFTKMWHECAYLLVKGQPGKPANPPPDVLPWKYSGNKFHPTQKPVSALTPLINAYSKEGDIVLDPFGGSGSTAECVAGTLSFLRKMNSFLMPQEFDFLRIARNEYPEPCFCGGLENASPPRKLGL
jgi:adenine-specific DNA-methyltransferase